MTPSCFRPKDSIDSSGPGTLERTIGFFKPKRKTRISASFNYFAHAPGYEINEDDAQTPITIPRILALSA